MTTKSWTLIDAETDRNVGDFSIGSAGVHGAGEDWSVQMRTLHGGRREGVTVVEIDNGLFRFAVVPTRGMGIWKGWMGEEKLGWQSPTQGPVHPNFVPLTEPSGLGWLDGFDELLVRCGLESNGAPEFDENHLLKYPLHGRIANLPAHRLTLSVDSEKGEIALTGEVDESRFHFQKLRLTSTVSTKFNDNALHIHDVVSNRSASPAKFQLLNHINIGAPLLDAGSQLLLPARKIVPQNDHAAAHIANWQTYPAATAGFEECVYFFELRGDDEGHTQVLLKNASGEQGVSLQFNRRQFPYFIQWKNTTATTDGYVTGIEPATNFPNARSFEEKQGRIVTLGVEETRTFDVTLRWHHDSGEIGAAEKSIRSLQGETPPQIIEKPLADWCRPG